MSSCTRTLNLRHQTEICLHVVTAAAPEVVWIGPLEVSVASVESLPSTIKYLDWDMGSQQDVAPEAMLLLLRMESLEHLTLKFQSKNILKSLGQWLPGSSLKSLQISKNRITDDDIVEIVPSFTSLDSLNLSYNLLTNRSAELLANTLADPSCQLKELDIRCNHIGEQGLAAIAQALCTNSTLHHLKIYGNNADGDCSHLFVTTLRQNTTLKKLYAEGGDHTEMLRYYLHLNQAGRRIIALEDNDLPVGVWPIVLGRVSTKPSLLNFFLKEMPSLITNSRDR